MKLKWKSGPLLHRIVAIICMVVSILVVTFAVLQICEILDQGINIVVPLLGVAMLCQAYLQWETNRKIAYLNIGTAIFVFICCVLVNDVTLKR